MPRRLATAGIAYHWVPALGGRGRPIPESTNVVLRHPQCRAYADHMATREFVEGIDELQDKVVGEQPSVAAPPDRIRAHHGDRPTCCDHLMHDGRRTPHPVLPGARRFGNLVVYDGR
jgi:hypothetical protein